MTTQQSSFELSPSGTAIPTTGSSGTGSDVFAAGSNGTGTAFVSDSSIPAAIADGSMAAKMTIPATAATVWRGWNISPTGSGVHFRLYFYTPTRVAGNWDFIQAAHTTGGTTTIARARMTATGQLVHVLGSVAGTATTGVMPLNALVRIEGSWNVANGTFTMEAYLGHDTTPIPNTSISLTGLTFTDTIEQFRIGFPTAGIASTTIYTDAWAVSDVARLGPAVVAAANLTATGTDTLGATDSASAVLTAGGGVARTGSGADTAAIVDVATATLSVGSSTGSANLVSQASGNTGTTAATGASMPGPAAPATFALLAVGRSGGQSTGMLTGVTDTAGNTWTMAARGAVSGATYTRLELWYCENYTPATTVSFTSGTAQQSGWNISGWTGLVSSGSLDVASPDNSFSASAASYTSPSITTTATDLVIAATQRSTTGTGPASPFVAMNEWTVNSTSGTGDLGYIAAAAPGTYSGTFTRDSGTSPGGVLTVGFKVAPAAAATSKLTYATPTQIASLSTTSPAALRAKAIADAVKAGTLVGGSTASDTDIKSVDNRCGPIALTTAMWMLRTNDTSYLAPLRAFILSTPKPPSTVQALNEWRGLFGVFAAVKLLKDAGLWTAVDDNSICPNHANDTWLQFLNGGGSQVDPYMYRQVDTSTSQRWRRLVDATGTHGNEPAVDNTPNNWGDVARATHMALASLLGNQAEIDHGVARLKKFFGDTTTGLADFYTTSNYLSSWDNWNVSNTVTGSVNIPAGIGKTDAANPGLDGVVINDIDRGGTGYSSTSPFYGATGAGLTYPLEGADYIWAEVALLVNGGYLPRTWGEGGNAFDRMNARFARHRIAGEQSNFDYAEASGGTVYASARLIASQLSGTDYERSLAPATTSGTGGLPRANTYGDWIAPADSSSLWGTTLTTAPVVNNRTAAPMDLAGATDTVSTVQVQAAGAADNLGAVDSVTASLGRSVTVNDTIAGSDIGSGGAIYNPAAADASTALDSAATALQAQRSSADVAGITDAVTITQSNVRTVADALSAADFAVPANGFNRTPADTAGITDAIASLISLGMFPADTATGTDAVTDVLNTVRSYTDASPNLLAGTGWDSFEGAGPTSLPGTNTTGSISTTWAETGTQSLRLVPNGTTNPDSFMAVGGDIGGVRLGMIPGQTYTVFGTVYVPAALTGTIQTNRATGIAAFTNAGTGYVETDSAWGTAPGVYRRRLVFTVPAGATEAFIRLYNGTTVGGGDVYWDNVGLYQGNLANPPLNGDLLTATDAVTIAQTFVRTTTVTDTEPGTDVAATALNAVRAPADALSSTDSVSTLLNQNSAPADPVGGADVVTQTRTSARTQADLLPATDAVGWTRSIPGGADTLGSTDTAAITRTSARTAADQLRSTDSVIVGGTVAQPIDTLAVVEADAHIGVRQVHRLKGRADIEATADRANLVKGPKARAVAAFVVTGSLQAVRALASDADATVDVDLVNPRIRIVRAMTDVIRTFDDLPMGLASDMTLRQMAEPVTAEPEPRRYRRTFQVLR